MSRASADMEWLCRRIRGLTVMLSAEEVAALEQRPVSVVAGQLIVVEPVELAQNQTKGEVSMTMQEWRPAIGVPQEDLDDPILRAQRAAIYGDDVLAREAALRRQAQTVDLRGDDEPAQDPWEGARRAARYAGKSFDPVATAGLRCALSIIGDGFDVVLRQRQQEKAKETQRHRWVVAIGGTVILRNGSTLNEGDVITEKMIDHAHAIEVIQAMVGRGVVSEIDAHVAWLQSLPETTGPYVATRDLELGNGKKLRRGQACCESDFPPLVRPPIFSDGDRLSDLKVSDLRQIIGEEIRLRVRGTVPDAPPPSSDFDCCRFNGSIELAPNYVAPASPKKGK